MLLKQEDGAWSFGGDGTKDFVSPLAPLPKDEHMTKYAVGDKVEVGPTDEGYVGSWYAAKVIATSGGKPGELHLEYTTLEESEGVPLREWQPRTILRPMPPPFAAGAPPAGASSRGGGADCAGLGAKLVTLRQKGHVTCELPRRAVAAYDDALCAQSRRQPSQKPWPHSRRTPAE